MIELVGIRKLYGGRVVLDIPHAVFETGRRYALLGENGSGKSTLLSILAGVVKPDAGEVRSDVPFDAVGYSPQSPYAFDLTVTQNVALALGNRRGSKLAAQAALTRVGLDHLARARGNRLSGGETQRMMLARMIACPHQLLLLDEPTSAIDMTAEEQIEQALLSYVADCGSTLIFSTHAPGQALRLATDALVLCGGRVAACGEAFSVLHTPQSEEARAFLNRFAVPAAVDNGLSV